MLTNFSLTTQTSVVPKTEYYDTDNSTRWWENLQEHLEQSLISSIILFIGILGFLGNGIVIWFLGFCMKRNSFMVYILNLALADLGVFISMAVFFAVGNSSSTFIYVELVIFTYSTSQFLLTAISVDRCVCVLFPIWHRLHRPSHLSITVCVLIWLFSFLLNGMHYTLLRTQILENDRHLTFFQFFVNALLCVPLMMVSALTLFIKICFKSQQRQRGKLLTAILLSLLFFLLFAFPLNASYVVFTFSSKSRSSPMRFGLLCASLNSCVNPIIYFLVGRKKGQSGESFKAMLQRILVEDEGCREEPQPPIQTQLSCLRKPQVLRH